MNIVNTDYKLEEINSVLDGKMNLIVDMVFEEVISRFDKYGVCTIKMNER